MQDGANHLSKKSPQRNIPNRLPLWSYIVISLIIVIALLSLLPGGHALPILIEWVLGWAVSIWVFRRFRGVRVFIIALLIIGVIFALIDYALARGVNGFGH